MGIANITALTDTMITPDAIIRGLDVTGYWSDAFLWSLFAVLIFATGRTYTRLSHRLAISAFITTILAVILYSVNFSKVETLYRMLVALVLSVVYLYMDKPEVGTVV